MITKINAAVLAAVMICGTGGVALGGRTTADLRSTDVAVRESSDGSYGPYFLIDVNVPGGVTSDNLMGAILEFYVDVDIRIDTVLVEEPDTAYTVVHRNPVPLIEVFALTSAPRQTLDPAQWDQALAFPTPIGLGTNKVVRIDITRLVTYYLHNPEANHGLIIGSLTGRRPGHFSLQESFAAGVRARIRYIHHMDKF